MKVKDWIKYLSNIDGDTELVIKSEDGILKDFEVDNLDFRHGLKKKAKVRDSFGGGMRITDAWVLSSELTKEDKLEEVKNIIIVK